MSSEKPAADRFIEAAGDLCEQALRGAYGPGGRRGSGTGSVAPGLVAVANESASTTTDLARQMAGIAVRGARTLGAQLVDIAGQLESALLDEPAGAPKTPSGAGEAKRATTDLVLPPTPAGGESSKSFDVVNRGRDAMGEVTLRCHGLAGPGGRSIPAECIQIEPDRVPLPARATTKALFKVKVPKATRRGTYTGSIEAPDHAGVRLQISLTVE